MIANTLDLERDSGVSLFADEDRILDEAFDNVDELLVSSLQADEQRRRRSRSIKIAMIISMCLAVAMGVAIYYFSEGAAFLAADASAKAESAKLTTQASQLWQARRYAEAEKMFAKAVELDPQSHAAWSGLGWTRFSQGKNNESIDAFNRCINIVDDHAAANNGLGQAYLAKKQYDQAERYLLKAEAKSSAASWGLAKIYLLTDKFDKALPYAERILGDSPNSEAAKQMVAAAKAKKLDEDFRKVLDPPELKETDLAAVKAWKLFSSGSLDAAKKEFEKILATDPNHLSALNGLGFCLLNAGEATKAKPFFEKHLKLQPKSGGPMNGLARCLKAEGKVEEAVKIWLEMERLAPIVSAATVGLAQTYLEQKQFEKSVKYFERLVKESPDNEFFKRGLEQAKAGIKP